jgi:hypothetical protein
MAKKLSRSKKDKGKNADPVNQSKNKKLVIVIGLITLFLIVIETVFYFTKFIPPPVFFVQVTHEINSAKEPCGPFTAWDMAALGHSRLVVSDQAHDRILIFSRNGQFLNAFGVKGNKLPDEFQEPSAIQTTQSNHIWVIDCWNGLIKEFTSVGKNLFEVNLNNKGFYGPRGFYYNGKSFYIADTGSHRIVKVSKSGTIESIWGKHGSAPGEFINPVAIASNHKDFFVTDAGNYRVQELNKYGKVIRIFKLKRRPSGVAVANHGLLFVSSNGGGFIEAFNYLTGKFLGKLKPLGKSSSIFQGVLGLSMTPTGRLLAAVGGHIYEMNISPKIKVQSSNG